MFSLSPSSSLLPPSPSSLLLLLPTSPFSSSLLLPTALPPHPLYHQPSAHYVNNMRKLVASYGVILGTNYLLVFILLVIIYWKILKYIKRMRIAHGGCMRRKWVWLWYNLLVTITFISNCVFVRVTYATVDSTSAIPAFSTITTVK